MRLRCAGQRRSAPKSHDRWLRHVASAIRSKQAHPELVYRQDELLRSINGCLRALCGKAGVSAGEDFEPLGTGWLDDLEHAESINSPVRDPLEDLEEF